MRRLRFYGAKPSLDTVSRRRALKSVGAAILSSALRPLFVHRLTHRTWRERTTSSGTLSFTATIFNVGTNSDPGRIVSADFDAQNGPDLAVTDFGLNKVSVLSNDGTGSFGTPTDFNDFSVGASPVDIVSTDLDGDGDPDLATANRDSNNVSVLLNTTPLAVTGTTPANAEIGVDRNVSPTATFSAEMNYPSTLNSSTVKLYQRKKGKWQRVTDTRVSCDSPCRTVTLDPYPMAGTDPAANKKYKVTITTGAEDTTGHHLAKNYSWTFTTGS